MALVREQKDDSQAQERLQQNTEQNTSVRKQED